MNLAIPRDNDGPVRGGAKRMPCGEIDSKRRAELNDARDAELLDINLVRSGVKPGKGRGVGKHDRLRVYEGPRTFLKLDVDDGEVVREIC